MGKNDGLVSLALCRPPLVPDCIAERGAPSFVFVFGCVFVLLVVLWTNPCFAAILAGTGQSELIHVPTCARLHVPISFRLLVGLVILLILPPQQS